MDILGTGVDIVEIKRIKKLREKYGRQFLDKIFTPEELKYSLKVTYPDSHLAARFAAKEAVAKALGTGISILGWKNISLLRKEGPPELVLKGRALGVAKEKGIKKSFVSLSHCREYAVAQVILTGIEGENAGEGCNR